MLAVCLLAIVPDAHAANRRWNGAAPDDNFGTTGNWVGGFVPGTLDVAQFGISGGIFQSTYNVNFNNNVTNQALHIEDDLVTFNLNARQYTVTVTNGIVVGNQAGGFTGRLTVNNGTISSSTNIDVGAAANTSGTLIIGAGGLISGAPTLNIGKLGTGTLTVQADGDISSTGSTTIGVGTGITGTATIIGNGTSGSATLLTGTLNVGATGTGSVNVQLGGLLQNSGAAVLGTGSLFTGVGTGTVNVMNAGSIWNSLGLLTVGNGGTGKVNITLGGKVTGTDNVIGASAQTGSSGEVNVNGPTSLWDNSGTVTVGDLGSGTLNVTNQGVVESTAGFIGDSNLPTSIGIVNVTGAGSRWTNTEELFVGNARTATLNITTGGTVQNRFGFVGIESSGTGTVTVDGSGSLWESSASIHVGDAGDGTLSITGGGDVHSSTVQSGATSIIGRSSGGTGTVTVDGSGSLWDHSGNLVVGLLGEATLSITAGGVVQNTAGIVGSLPDGTGAVTVDGAGSRWELSEGLTVGNFAQGTPNVTAGGTLNITGGGHVLSGTGGGFVEGRIGSQAGSTGLVAVDGDGSLWEGTSLFVGDEGDGTLNITAGGIVRDIGARLGFAASGTGHVTVDGIGSLWDNQTQLGDLIVGERGRGTLEITGGGMVLSAYGILSGPTNAPSTVIVSGPGSQWHLSSGLDVGRSLDVMVARAGTLEITDGGIVTTVSGAYIGRDDNTTGVVTVAGANSTWAIGGKLGIGSEPFTGTNHGVGTLRIQPGGAVSVTENTSVSRGDLVSLEGGTLSTSAIDFVDGGSVDFNFQWTSGTLHVGSFDGDLVNQGGVLAPGISVGHTSIDGDYNQLPGATLQIEVGGLIPNSEFDSVTALGDAFLGGNLQLALIGGFVPNATDTFVILRAAFNVFGDFDNVANGQRLATSDGLGSFVVLINPAGQVSLSNFLATAIPGDYNGNGTVDAADYTLWRDHLGQSFMLTNENPAAATPGVVDTEDYAFWKSHFGNSLGNGSGAAGSASAAVPEPATLMMIIVAIMAMFTRDERLCH